MANSAGTRLGDRVMGNEAAVTIAQSFQAECGSAESDRIHLSEWFAGTGFVYD